MNLSLNCTSSFTVQDIETNLRWSWEASGVVTSLAERIKLLDRIGELKTVLKTSVFGDVFNSPHRLHIR